jgi:cytochrome c-type biogenesis protein CcmH/NrfG
MLSEEIRGIANYIIVGLLIDNKIIRLLYPLANKVEKLEDDLDRAEGERVQFGDRVVYLEGFNQSILTENRAMRKALDILIEDASSISIQSKIRMIAIGLGAWKRAMDKLKDER